MDLIRNAYNHVFYDRSDLRVKDWPLMWSPVPAFIICVTYLTLVKVLLPIYMRNRKPYNLRTIIKWYNVVQIIANIICTWGILTSGWTTTYNLKCAPPDYSTTPENMRMLKFMWWTMVIKLLEFCETVFFILRRKERQASFLHIYHHVSTFLIVWSGTKYVGGGITTFPPMLNNAVHVLMYTYYLLSAEGSPRVKKFLAKYKKWLTIIQMVQFTLLIVYTAQIFLPGCDAPLGITPFYYLNVFFVYKMFYDFYQQNYTKKGKEALKRAKNSNGVHKIH